MTWDSVWEQVFSSQEWGKYPPEDLIRFIAGNFYNVKDRSSVRVLEVGCGPGANLWFLAREGFTLYGLDGSRTAIIQASNRLDAECPGWEGRLDVGDISALPYADEFFDAVVDIEALCHNSYVAARKIYMEIARVLKKGGKLYSKTFAPGTWGLDETSGVRVGHNEWIASEGNFKGKGLTRFTEYEEIDNLLAGFQIETVELLIRTVGNREKQFREWLITGTKRL